MLCLKLTLQYDGTSFFGYQRQEHKPSVQADLEQAIYKITGKMYETVAAGRTDRGVHAMGQVVHVKLDKEVESRRFIAGLNHYLSEAVRCVDCTVERTDFHARYDARRKTYRYYLYNDYFMPPMLRHYRGHRAYPLDIDAMKEAACYLQGLHDFRAFTTDLTEEIKTLRILEKIAIQKKHHDIVFTFQARSFLKHMVRILVGTLIDVGRGHHDPEYVKQILSTKAEKPAGMTVEASGLYLWNVEY